MSTSTDNTTGRQIVRLTLTAIISLGIGLAVGLSLGRMQARAAIVSGPDSDNYRPARAEIQAAADKLPRGDTNIFEHLSAADDHIRQAQEWTKRFLGEKL